jgi:hypothetical protein
LLGFSSFWSIVSIIVTFTNYYKMTKKQALSLGGFGLQFLFAAVSTLCRISAVIVYFAPSFGLFSLLMHWKMGRIDFEEGDGLVYGQGPMS